LATASRGVACVLAARKLALVYILGRDEDEISDSEQTSIVGGPLMLGTVSPGNCFKLRKLSLFSIQCVKRLNVFIENMMLN